jgi:hypothetical protein
VITGGTHSDADPGNRFCQQVNQQRHDGRGDDPRPPEIILGEQVERQRGRDQGAPDIDGDDGAGILLDYRHHVVRAAIDDFPAGPHDLLGELPYRNVDVAAEQRGQQQQQRRSRTDAKAFVGVAQDIDLDEDEDEGKDTDQDGEERRRDWRVIMHLAHGSPDHRHRRNLT